MTNDPARDKFLSRLFGLFNEEVVRHWCRYPEAPYEDLGRPSLYEPGERRGYTLDFTLRRRATGEVFVAEMKCELEFQGYRYLRLTSANQVRHHRTPAFQRLLRLAKQPEAFEVRVAGQPVQVHGAVLVWGATDPNGCVAVQEEYGFSEVLSVERMLDDMHHWEAPHWTERVNRLRYWSNALFDALL